MTKQFSEIFGQRVNVSCIFQCRSPKTLARSKSLCSLFQVQTKQWGCNRQGITCNCGVVIRDHNDLISFSCCGKPPKVHRDDFTPISVDIPRKKCLAPGITITQLIKGFNSKYEVFPCCFIILIYRDADYNQRGCESVFAFTCNRAVWKFRLVHWLGFFGGHFEVQFFRTMYTREQLPPGNWASQLFNRVFLDESCSGEWNPDKHCCWW